MSSDVVVVGAGVGVGLSWLEERGSGGGPGVFAVFLHGIAEGDLAGLRAGEVAVGLIGLMDLHGLAEFGDLDHANAVALKADEADGLWDAAVDPLFVVGGVLLLLAVAAVFFFSTAK